MKIEYLEFTNLNSLRGAHTIDFTASPLGNAGLFAVTGPTGSGKTTIFDAVCLGLFGQTPRLSKKGGRDKRTGIWEIVTRGCTESLCEVRFQAGGRKYHSRWEIHRAHKRLDKDFVDPVMRLSMVSTDGTLEIIEDKYSAVPDAVEKVCGLSFDRFIRSVMLAQGGFDAFLQVPPGERAALLEKLTGTSIYSRLSKEAYLRFIDEQNVLETLRSRRENIQLLSREEREALENTVARAKNESRKIDNEIENLRQILSQYSSLDTLKTELTNLEAAAEDLENEAENIAVLEEKAEKASKAESCRMVVKDLDIREDEVSREEGNIRDCFEEISNTEAESRKAREKEEGCRKAWEEARDGNLEKQALAEEGRRYESEIASLTEQKTGIEHELIEAEEELELLKEKEKELRSSMGSCNAEINLFEEWRKKTPGGTELLESWELIENRLNRKMQAINEKTGLEKSIEDLDRDTRDQQTRLQTLENRLDAVRREIALIQNKVDDSRLLQKKIPSARALHSEAVRRMEKAREYAELEEERIALLGELESLEKAMVREKEVVDSLKESVTSPRNVTILSLILRRRLKAGKPCSVCGSREHPVTAELDLSFEESDPDVSEVISAFDELTRRESQLSIYEENRKNTSTAYKKLEKKMRTLLEIPKEYNSVNEYISAELRPAEQRLKEEALGLEKAAEEAAAEEYECREKETQGKQLEEDITECRLLIQKYRTEQSGAEKELEKLNRECGELDTILEAYGGLKMMKMEDARNLFEEGAAFRDKASGAVKTLQGLSEELSSVRTSGASAEKRKKELGRRGSELEKRIDALVEKRNKVTGGIDVKKFISDSESMMDAAQREFLNAQRESSTLEGRLSSLKQRFGEIQVSLETLKEAAEKQKTNTLTQIRASGFASISEVRDALVDRDRLEKTEEEIRRFRQEEERIGHKLDEVRVRTAEIEKDLADKEPSKDIEERIKKQTSKKEDLLSGYGGAREQISRDDEAKAAAKELDAQMNEQEKIFKVWNRMRSLIGSRDGGAFQRFAQSVTLDRLIDNANGHLRGLSSRYVLGRRDEEQLSLEITDTWQGGIVRPVTTLSGGETFIVSLSLALGLSSLVSSRMSLETLFLDEGFGTLDSETLETVLSVLETVRSRGKHIGVISHVDALKERIPVKIEVIPLGNGHSKLEISG